MATDPNQTSSNEPQTMRFAPGFFTETSARGAPQRWKTGNRIRFRGGEPEKMGGWLARDIEGAAHDGVARRAHEWTSLDGESWIAVGTNTKLFLISRDTRYNITPIRRTTDLTNPFSTQSGSPTVTVTDAGHGAEVGDTVAFTGASTVAGLTITGDQVVTSVLGDTYTFTALMNANATTTGGGTVHAEYEINVGTVSQTLALGYGVGAYGEGTYGTARDIADSGIVRRLRVWSLDNFGEDLIASPRGGAVYHWDRSNGPESRAQLLDQAPATNQRVLVSNSGGQIICLGAFDNVGNRPDPMLIRVGEEESLTGFVVDDENTAFDKRLATGSEIITGFRTRGGIFVSTDEAFYVMNEDPSEIYVVTKLSGTNGLLSPNAGTEVDGVVYGMTRAKFMMYDGIVQEIPCDVRKYVFDDEATRVNLDQSDKVHCWYNEDFSEVWWMYPAGASTEVDTYVVLNTVEKVWYYGTLDRTAAIPPGTSYRLPVAISTDGTLYLHETGKDDDLDPMEWSLESHDFELAGGKRTMIVPRVVTDMTRQASTFDLYLKSKRRPQQATYVTKGPYQFAVTTERRGTNIRGRQLALRMENSPISPAASFVVAQNANGPGPLGFGYSGDPTDPFGTKLTDELDATLFACATLTTVAPGLALTLQSATPLTQDFFTSLTIYEDDHTTERQSFASADATFLGVGGFYTWGWITPAAFTLADVGSTFFVELDPTNQRGADFRLATVTLDLQPDSEE